MADMATCCATSENATRSERDWIANGQSKGGDAFRLNGSASDDVSDARGGSAALPARPQGPKGPKGLKGQASTSEKRNPRPSSRETAAPPHWVSGPGEMD